MQKPQKKTKQKLKLINAFNFNILTHKYLKINNKNYL